MNILKKAACTVAAICMAQAAFSVPADPRPKKVRQADGTVITVHVRGDEYGHMVFNDKGEALSFDQATGCFKISNEASVNYQKALNAKRSKYKKHNGKNRLLISNYPTTGSPRSLVLLIEFSDVEFSSVDNPKDFYTRMLNEEGFTYSNGAEGSVNDFFIASSMGQFTPQFDVVGPIKLSKPRKHYGGDTPEMD